jgi:regulator of replication initiation timing
LYSSHLASWRGERERGELAGLAEKKRGRKVKVDKALVQENQRLSREVARLEKRLAQAETIIEVQKKVATLLGIPLKSPGDDGSSS